MTPGYHAAHHMAALFPRDDRGLLVVSGHDRLSWLQGLVTNDVAFGGPGVAYAAWLTPQGRMITDVVVIETGGEVWLDVPRSLAGELSRRLDLLIFTEDARVTDRSDAITSLSVCGPEAIPAVERALDAGDATRPLERSSIAVLQDGTGKIVVVAASDTGVPGVRVYAAISRISRLVDALGATGVPRLDGLDALALRVEAGVPAFLVDMGDETIPLEANLDHALSHTKGCYVGQEIIVRIRDRAHGRVARRLVGLVVDGDAAPAVPQGVTSGGRQAGRVTSAVVSPALGRPIALATLLRDFTEPGTRVTLDSGTTATVAVLPFG